MLKALAKKKKKDMFCSLTEIKIIICNGISAINYRNIIQSLSKFYDGVFLRKYGNNYFRNKAWSNMFDGVLDTPLHATYWKWSLKPINFYSGFQALNAHSSQRLNCYHNETFEARALCKRLPKLGCVLSVVFNGSGN